MAAPEQTQPQPSMRLAEILSDLVSLRVCDPTAALSLVSARSSPSTSTLDAQPSTTAIRDREGDEEDVELKRAKELLRLHYEVKMGHKRGEVGRGLEEARGSVERAVGG